METTGYAAALAELTDEPVYLVHLPADDPDPVLTWDERGGWLSLDGQVKPVRGCFRYVTQRPWNRLPPVSKVPMLNPVLACLAGGRNKLVAAKAYEFYNAELAACASACPRPSGTCPRPRCLCGSSAWAAWPWPRTPTPTPARGSTPR